MKKTLILLMSIFTLNIHFAHAQGHEGGCGGHGGDSISQEFYQIGNLLYQQLSKLPPHELATVADRFQIAMFKEALNKTLIESTEESLTILTSNGVKEVDSINAIFSGKPQIKTNRPRWRTHANIEGLKTKQAHVLHEYLGIMKHLHSHFGEWDEYSLSNNLMNLLEKHEKLATFNNEAWIHDVLASFDNSSSYLNFYLPKGQNYSCVEYSTLSPGLPPLTHINNYNSDSLLMSDSNAANNIVFGDNDLRDDIRANSRGDLIIKKIDATNRNLISLSYCSKLGSIAVQKTKNLAHSLAATFDLAETEEYVQFQKQITLFKKSRVFKNCITGKSIDSCNQAYLKLNSIKPIANATAAASAKTSLNLWLDSIGDKRDFVIKPITQLFKKFSIQQNDLQNLFTLENSDYMQIAIQNYMEQMTNLAPIFSQAKSEFLFESERAQDALIESFSPLY